MGWWSPWTGIKLTPQLSTVMLGRPTRGGPLEAHNTTPPEADPMTDADTVWLVERDYTDKGLVTIVYATTDGSRHVRMQRSSNMLQSSEVTAAIEAETDRLVPTEDADARERYAQEAQRMAERHDPDDAV
jgi:hypothetical protein